MDLILSKDPSRDAHVMQLEPAKMEVDPLVQRERSCLCQLFFLYRNTSGFLPFNIFWA